MENRDRWPNRHREKGKEIEGKLGKELSLPIQNIINSKLNISYQSPAKGWYHISPVSLKYQIIIFHSDSAQYSIQL